MKKALKKSAYLISALLILGTTSILNNACSAINIWPFNSTSQSENKSSETFDFIKSNEKQDGFFNANNILLYGGIALIATSVLGIIITLKPKKHKGNRAKKTRHTNNKHSDNR